MTNFIVPEYYLVEIMYYKNNCTPFKLGNSNNCSQIGTGNSIEEAALKVIHFDNIPFIYIIDVHVTEFISGKHYKLSKEDLYRYEISNLKGLRFSD